MPYIPFEKYCSEIARMETRTITLLSDDNEFGLPSGTYGFVEMFCDECDCRRVFFLVVKEGIEKPVAVICYCYTPPIPDTKHSYTGRFPKSLLEYRMEDFQAGRELYSRPAYRPFSCTRVQLLHNCGFILHAYTL